ncbi:MAG: beta-galactosidase [Candidatus Hydrogenedentes bacterium]|nr:beta-galactosidase [Candidatus Hydrogenedentota bacterium]
MAGLAPKRGDKGLFMRIGVAYYPEHWDESRWARDAALMQAAGIQVVRLAEFAWSRLEPEEGKYDFEWLDRAVALLSAYGMEVVLGTPTAAPPAWLHERFPDLYPMDERRYPLGFGTRLQRCLNHPGMRIHSQFIVEALARHYGSSAAVVGWQTDNEFTANLCYCPHCHHRFHEWLRDKYGDLARLNAAWGTVFWSQEYTAWGQVPLPWATKCDSTHNPSLQLDFRRFQSDATVSFQREQIEIIRAHTARQFVTHNFMGTHDSMDYYALGEALDLVSWDNYPHTPWWVSESGAGFGADVMRGIKRQNFWVMEQQNGIAGWSKMGRRIPDAQLRCWAWQAVAHGADTVTFFRWRSCRFGAEQFWHGILNHDGEPRGRYREVRRLAGEFASVRDALTGTVVRSEIAILNGYDQHYALQIQPQADGLAYWEQAGRYYTALRQLGHNVDIVPIDADLSGYRALILPSWCVIEAAAVETLSRYVKSGGRLIISARSGLKDGANVCVDAPLPGALAAICGVEVEDYDPLGGATSSVCDIEGVCHTVSVWADALLLHGAEAKAWYADGLFRGLPALSRFEYGAGSAWYFGCFGDGAFYHHFLKEVLNEAKVAPELPTPPGVEVCWREKEGERYLFVLNLTREPASVHVPGAVTALLGAAPADGVIALEPFGASLFRCEAVRADGARAGNGKKGASSVAAVG